MLKQANCGNSGFNDILFETVLEFCREKEEKRYLEEFLTNNGGIYWQNVGTSFYEEIGEEEQYLHFRMKHLESEWDYMDLVMHYDGRDMHAEAVKIAEAAALQDAAGEKIFNYLFDEYTEAGKNEEIWRLYHTLENMNPNTGLVL